MEDIIIKVRSKLINYDLRFEHNLNIIRGDSATGKSTLIRIIDNKKSSNVSIESNYNIFHLTSDILEGGFKLNENTVYLMDENDGIEEKIVINELNRDKYKFILFSLGVDSSKINNKQNQVYEFYFEDKCNKNRKIIKKENNWGWE